MENNRAKEDSLSYTVQPRSSGGSSDRGDDEPIVGRKMRGPRMNRARLPTPYHVLPLAVLWAIAAGLADGNMVLLLKAFYCKFYYHLYPHHKDLVTTDPHRGFASVGSHMRLSMSGLGRCAATEVGSFTDSMAAGQTVVQGVLDIFAMSLISDLVSRWGRKPTGAVILCLQLLEIGSLMLVMVSNGSLSAVLFAFSTIAGSATGDTGMVLVFNSYIVDLVKSEERAAFFGYILAAIYTSMGVGSALGGVAKTYFHYFLAPLWLSLGFASLAILYSICILPESLTRERKQNFGVTEETSDGVAGSSSSNVYSQGGDVVQEPAPTNVSEANAFAKAQTRNGPCWHGSKLANVLGRLDVFKKLSVLLPDQNAGALGRGEPGEGSSKGRWSSHGRANASTVEECGAGVEAESVEEFGNRGRGRWNITICAAAFVLQKTGTGFLRTLMILALTSAEMGFGQKDIGFLLSYQTFTRAIILFFIHPLIIRLGRSCVSHLAFARTTTPDSEQETRPLLPNRGSAGQISETGPHHTSEARMRPTNIFDIYWAAASFCLCALGIGGLGMAKTYAGVYLCAGMIAFADAGTAALQAFASEMVESSMADSVLAAFSILEVFACIASPVILGAISAASSKHVAFAVSGALLAAAGLSCLLTRKRNHQQGA